MRYFDFSYSEKSETTTLQYLSVNNGKELIITLKKLMKRRDFFVTPAAVAALCAICRDGSSTLRIAVIMTDALPNIDQLRKEAIQCHILVTLIELFKFDNQGLTGGPRGLTKLAKKYSLYPQTCKNTLLTR